MSTIYLGDCLDLLRSLPEASVDAIVTDPPYGIGFMMRQWDASVPGLEWAQECLRVLRPGGHLVAFGGTRTVHRLASAVEDAGFEVRDTVSWVYYSGFPKSLDVSKAVDKIDRGGAMRARALRFTAWMRSTGMTAAQINAATGTFMGSHYLTDKEQPAVATADLFDLLRPLLPAVPDEIEELVRSRTVDSENMKRRAVVGITTGYRLEFAPGEGRAHSLVAREITAPYTDAACTWEGWGTALKPAQEPAILARKPLAGTVAANVLAHGTGAINIDGCRFPPGDAAWVGPDEGDLPTFHGRTGSSIPTSYELGAREPGQTDGQRLGRWPANLYHCPKASRSERERGCDGLPARSGTEAVDREEGSAGVSSPRAGAGRSAESVHNHHPTVKPVRLMRWLCRLVAPPGGVVLDPFTGSGSTGVAAVLEGFRFQGAEREPDYHRIAVARIAHAQRYPEAWADTAPGRQDEAVEEVEELERMGQVRLFGGGE